MPDLIYTTGGGAGRFDTPSPVDAGRSGGLLAGRINFGCTSSHRSRGSGGGCENGHVQFPGVASEEFVTDGALGIGFGHDLIEARFERFGTLTDVADVHHREIDAGPFFTGLVSHAGDVLIGVVEMLDSNRLDAAIPLRVRVLPDRGEKLVQIVVEKDFQTHGR